MAQNNRKAKNCPRLLEPQKGAPKAKSCRAQSGQDYPTIQASVKFRFRDFLRQLSLLAQFKLCEFPDVKALFPAVRMDIC